MKASGVFLLALVLCSALLAVNAAASDEHAPTGFRKLLTSKTFGHGLGGSRYSGFGYGTRGGWNNYGSGYYGSGYGGYGGYYGRGGYGGYGRGSGYGYGRRSGYGRGWGK